MIFVLTMIAKDKSRLIIIQNEAKRNKGKVISKPYKENNEEKNLFLYQINTENINDKKKLPGPKNYSDYWNI